MVVSIWKWYEKARHLPKYEAFIWRGKYFVEILKLKIAAGNIQWTTQLAGDDRRRS